MKRQATSHKDSLPFLCLNDAIKEPLLRFVQNNTHP